MYTQEVRIADAAHNGPLSRLYPENIPDGGRQELINGVIEYPSRVDDYGGKRGYQDAHSVHLSAIRHGLALLGSIT